MGRIGGLKRFLQGRKVKSKPRPQTGSTRFNYSNEVFSFKAFKPFKQFKPVSFFRDVAYNVVKDSGDTLSDVLYPAPESYIDRKVLGYKLKLEQEKKARAKLELKNKREKGKSKQFSKSK